jgi:hypothetical protein
MSDVDYQKIVEELAEGPVGDIARERFVNDVIATLPDYVDEFDYEKDEDREKDRAWLAEAATWLRDQYF